MHFVCLTNNMVTDQCQADPYQIFTESYASQFIEAPDEVTFGWSLVDGAWTPPPGPTPQQIQEQNKSQASVLLSQTDWTTIPDVSDPIKSNPYLVNQNDFVEWRNQIRQIAVNPPTFPVVFPDSPQEIWSST